MTDNMIEIWNPNCKIFQIQNVEFNIADQKCKKQTDLNGICYSRFSGPLILNLKVEFQNLKLWIH